MPKMGPIIVNTPLTVLKKEKSQRCILFNWSFLEEKIVTSLDVQNRLFK